MLSILTSLDISAAQYIGKVKNCCWSFSTKILTFCPIKPTSQPISGGNMYSSSILRYLYFFLQYIYFIAILRRLLTCLRSVYETWCIAVLIQCCPKWGLKNENKTKQKKCSSFHVAVHFRIVWFILHSTVFVFMFVLYWSLFPLR